MVLTALNGSGAGFGAGSRGISSLHEACPGTQPPDSRPHRDICSFSNKKAPKGAFLFEKEQENSAYGAKVLINSGQFFFNWILDLGDHLGRVVRIVFWWVDDFRAGSVEA